MENLASDDPRAVAVAAVAAVQTGDVEGLRVLLRDNPGLANAGILDAKGGERTLLRVAADWPGHFPNGAATVAALIAAGADPNPPTPAGPDETALHWAASSDDVAVLDALLDGGADIEAPGEGYTGGAPMANAVIYAQWNAARRLLERGARTTLWQAAALGLRERVAADCATQPPPTAEEVTNAFWYACRGGQRPTAEDLLARGADINWIGHGDMTPLQAARESGNVFVAAWLRGLGAKTTDELQ